MISCRLDPRRLFWAAIALAVALAAGGPPAGLAGERGPAADPAPGAPTLTLPLLLKDFPREQPVNKPIYLPAIWDNRQVAVSSIFGAQIYDAPNAPSAGLALAGPAGVRWLRWELAWSRIEPANTTPDRYDFQAYDAPLLAANRAGHRLVMTVISNPAWAATYANGPIDRVGIDEFVQFMVAVAERYDGDGVADAPGSPVVDYWELYNEPDGASALRAEFGAGYWGHFGDQYAVMLCAIYPAIKAASPNVRVTLGGLAYDAFETADPPGPFARNFIDDVLKAGGGRCFDVMNFHYYPAFAVAWDVFGRGLSGKANFLRGQLVLYGVGAKPMIVTEAGWHSNDYSIYPSTPEIQARYVVKFFAQSLASALDVMIWWTWEDPASYYGATGLLDNNLQPKPAYTAYSVAASRLRGAKLDRALSEVELGHADLEGYLFHTTSVFYLLWSNTETLHETSLPILRGREVDMYGRFVREVADADDGQVDGRIQVSAGPSPIYVEVVP
jgi:hypothetical protein